MAECSKCGKESMSFTCKYCGDKFCSDHRLPESHDCEGLEESVEEEREENRKWFEEKKVKNPAPSQKKKKQYRKPSLTGDLKRMVSSNITLSIIAFTTLFYFIQTLLNAYPDSQIFQIFYNLLVLDPAISNVLTRPWTLLTVMILHGGPFHLFANMVTFYFFGSPIERLLGGKRLLKFYIGAGIAASIGFVLFRNILFLLHESNLQCLGSGCASIGVLGPAVGASGAVVATFAVVSRLYPEAEVLLYFIIPLKIRTAFMAFAAFEGINMLIMLLGYTVPVIGGLAFSAHFTGLIIGLWYGEKIKEEVSPRRTGFDLLAR